MILFINNGRLGNQLFHFAFIRKIAHGNEPIVLLGMAMLFQCFDFDKHRIYHTRNAMIQYMMTIILRLLCRLGMLSEIGIQRMADGRPMLGITQRKGVLPAIRVVKADFYQSESFFDADIVHAVTIKERPMTEAKAFMAQLPADPCKVFIHVRRGDYTEESYLGSKGLSLPLEYYKKAVARMRDKVEDPIFIVLTDDKAFASRLFGAFSPMVLSEHSTDVDFAIMTLCEAAIISNSSFSWWGAYYMKKRRVVISPRYWLGWRQKIESCPHIQAHFFDVIEVDTSSDAGVIGHSRCDGRQKDDVPLDGASSRLSREGRP